MLVEIPLVATLPRAPGRVAAFAVVACI